MSPLHISTPERWQRVKAIVAEAMDGSPAERAAILDRACGDDPALRHEVTSLLEAAAEPAEDPLHAMRDAPLAGRYAVEREIGRGGMAIVYLARDVRHDRLVALKVMRPELAALLGAERFLREISITAQLQHPNILPLFDSGEVCGDDEGGRAKLLFYVMPFVEGESLRARLAREGSLPVSEALHIAVSVAGALAYAHKHGVVHRDLKPENILLQAGEPLVADFGIALALEQAGGARLTKPGLSLGTPQYMAPEQALGKQQVSARADVYALGVVLYEMLVGEPPFTGSTAQAVVARVLTESPRSLTVQRASVPRAVDSAVRAALEKLPADRFATADEFARALDASPEASASRGETTSLASREPDGTRIRRSRAMRVLAGAALAVGGLAAGIALDRALRPARAAVGEPVRFFIEPDSVGMGFRTAISPDGRTVVYAANGLSGQHLFVRRIDDVEDRALAGTEGGHSPFFSPDGAWVGFVSGGAIQKMPASGGPVSLVTQVAGQASLPAGAWATDDTIYFTTSDHAFYRVPAAGGAAAPVVIRDLPAGIGGVFSASPLPGGRTLLVETGTGSGPGTMSVLDLASGHLRRPDLGRGRWPRYAAGYLVYTDAEGRLYRRPFDVERSAATGPAEEIASDVARFAVSAAGAVVYHVGGDVARLGSRIIITDRAGRELQTLPALGPWAPRFSPDGRRVAYGALAPGRDRHDLWVTELGAGTTERLTTDGGEGADDNDPQWSPHGDSIVYSAGWPETEKDIFVRALAGGPARRVTNAAGGERPTDWSPDGRTIPFTRKTAGGGVDIWIQPVDGSAPRPYAVTEAWETGARVSPNGRWAAYASSETGRAEIYVQAYPTPGRKTLVSAAGGLDPSWGRDGRTLYYWEWTRSSDMRLVAVTVTPDGPDGPLVVRARTPLFLAQYIDDDVPNYDVSPDGRRVVLVAPRAHLNRLVVALHALDGGKRDDGR